MASIFDTSVLFWFETQYFVGFMVHKLFLFCVILKVELNSSSQMRYFWRFFHPMFAICDHANIDIFVHVWTWNYVSPICSKFAVECDWKRMFSQNVQNLGFFGKKLVFRKNLKFFKIDSCSTFFSRMRLKWYFFLKTTSTLFFSFFLTKSEKKQGWKS